jgi:hypothetical protein
MLFLILAEIAFAVKQFVKQFARLLTKLSDTLPFVTALRFIFIPVTLQRFLFFVKREEQ